MNNATDEMRRMLDERGIEYETPTSGLTVAQIGGVQYKFYEHVGPETNERDKGKVFVVTEWLTPEQVIAATLGAGTCHISVQDNIVETEGMGDVWLECDECHWQMQLEPSTPRFKFCPNCGAKAVSE